MNNYAYIISRRITVSKSTQAWYIWTTLLVLWSYVDFVREKLDIVNDAVKVQYIPIYGLHIALRQCTFHTREPADRIW